MQVMRLVLGVVLFSVFSCVTNVGDGELAIDSKKQARPNFIVILADDLGYGDISSYQGWIQTPEIDRMAVEGMRFTDFHSNGPVCSPTRAALMTGRYQQRAGIPGVVTADPQTVGHRKGLQDREWTLAEALKENGYATGLIGKWHLGYYPNYNPTRHGFDEFRGFLSGNVDYFAKIDQAGAEDWWSGEEQIREPGYVTSLITRHALNFIDRNKDRPFFLFVAHAAPHYPYQGPEDNGFRISGQKRPRLDDDEDRIRLKYREMVTELDRGVGRIVRKVKNLDLAGNTLIFFASDNGANQHGRNKPFRGLKGGVLEGGHRVPAIGWWPGRIGAGTINDSLAALMDLMPTFLSLAGVSVPEDHHLDGIDLSEALLNGRSFVDRRMFWQFKEKGAMRDGRWKLVGSGGETQLYDLTGDPAEEHDLSIRYSSVKHRMAEEFQAWLFGVTVDASELKK